MKWALAGASDIAATQVLPALREIGEEVVSVFSSTLTRAEDFAATHRIARPTANLVDALHGVDAVYVSSTNEKHFEQADTALRHGVHVLCEKPLALDVQSARSLVALAVEEGFVLATNHHLRNSPVLSTIREMVSQGEIGELLSVRINHAVSLPERLRGWRLDSREAGGGVVLDLTVHDIDTVRFLTGLEPTSITAIGVSQGLGDGVEDAVMTVGTLGNTVLFGTHDAFTVAHNVTSVELHGTTGTLIGTDCLTPAPIGNLELRRAGSVELIKTPTVKSLYVPSLRAFVDAVAGNATVVASGDDGRRAVETALGAVTSLREGCIVRLSLDTDKEAM